MNSEENTEFGKSNNNSIMIHSVPNNAPHNRASLPQSIYTKEYSVGNSVKNKEWPRAWDPKITRPNGKKGIVEQEILKVLR